MKPATALLLGIGGVALLVATTQAKDKPSKPPLPTGERDCIREAAEILALKMPTLLNKAQMAAVAQNFRAQGLDLAADCLEKLSEGQEVDCSALLVGPLEEELRRIRDPAVLRDWAKKLRLLGLSPLADCLDGEAAKYELTV